MHFHTWRLADSYVPFHTQDSSNVKLADFIEGIGKPKVIFTDHCNPTEILSKIKEHNGVEYDKLTTEEKERFLREENMGKHVNNGWEQGWQATQMQCTRETMDAAALVTHVSGAQMRLEKDMLLPGLNTDNHTVLYNGIDLFKYADYP